MRTFKMPCIIKFVPMLILHSIFVKVSLETEGGSSEASSHVNLDTWPPFSFDEPKWVV